MSIQITAKEPRTITEADATAAEDAAQHYWGGLRDDAYFKLLQARRALPIHQKGVREEFLRLYQGDNQVMVVVGETGSGKSTQIPGLVMLSEHHEPGRGAIFCTQPRRDATRSVAERVAAEQGGKIGQAVGYVHRGEQRVNPNTILTYATDGMLIERLKSDKLLRLVSTVIIDEAHERTQATDLLLGVLKEIMPKRPDLKVIIMSAPLDAATTKFRDFFGGAERVPLLAVKGRTHPVTIRYSLRALKDYINCAIRIVIGIHRGSEDGHILLFMPGKEEIMRCVGVIKEENKYADDLDVFPLYSGMNIESQRQAIHGFENSQNRRCIVTTNIAEASITIDGVRHVVDPGLTNIMSYNPRLRSHRLQIAPYSKANATLRAGCAGRTAPGTCYRLYAREDFENLADMPRPQMSLSEMGTTILSLLGLQVESIWAFNFIDPPAAESICVEKDKKLTPLGRMASMLPLPPHQAVALCKASSSGCAKQIAQIISFSAVDTVYDIPPVSTSLPEARVQALRAVDKLGRSYGDHMTLFFIWVEFEKQHGVTCRSDRKCTKPVSWHKELADWCAGQSLICEALLKVEIFFWELKQSMLRINLALTSVADPYAKGTQEILLKALLEGFFIKLAVKDDNYNQYFTFAEAQPGLLHPENSFAFVSDTPGARNNQYAIVMYDQFSLVGPKHYFVKASGIDSQWIFESEPARAYVNEMIKLHTGANGEIKKLPARRLADAKAKFERNHPQEGPAS